MSIYPIDARSKRNRYEGLRSALKGTRSGGGFDSHWQDIANFLFPRRVRFQTSDLNKGGKTNQNIVDSTGKFALWTFRSGLHAGLTSPARPWFKLGTPDPDLAEFPSVKEYLHIVTQRMYTVFASSNLYNALPVLYGDFGLFGTAAMGCFEDDEDLFRNYVYPCGSYAMAVNDRGKVNTFVRDVPMTVRQIVEKFGVVPGTTTIDWTNISTAVHSAWNEGNYETVFDVVHLVKPNDDRRDWSPLARHKKFSSCWWEAATQEGADKLKLLRESGFDEFPIFAPRWEVTGNDAYGTDSPGMTALGDVIQLQGMTRKKGQLLEKAVDPPLKGPPSIRNQKVSLLPGDMTYTDSQYPHGLSPIHEVRLEGYQHITADAADTRMLIRRAFFEDLFLMIAASDEQRSGQMTAREVEERHAEKLVALGPILERTNDELLNPLIDRVFAMMEKSGLLPPAPREVQGVKLKVEYVSILAQAQKTVGVASLDRFTSTVLPIIEIDPSQRHKVNFDQLIELYQDALGVDPRVIRTTEEAEAMQAAEAQQQQQLANAQTAKDLATAAATAGKAPVAPGSPLDQVMGAMGQQAAPVAAA